MLYELLSKSDLISLFANRTITWPAELTGELITVGMLTCFVALSGYEFHAPRDFYSAWQTRRSYQTNLSLFAFNIITVIGLSVTMLLEIAECNAAFGLLSFVINPVLKALLAFLAVDLLLYWWNRFCHQFEFLWLFHRVHHSDCCLNVSTAFRVHFLEIVTTTCLKAGLIILLGIDKMTILAIETLVLISMMFKHTNAHFKFQCILGSFIAVPVLQKIHNTTKSIDHNHNYGIVLSIWDKLFGTFSMIESGRIGHKVIHPEKTFDLLRYGFGWEEMPSGCPVNMESMIAEAAFYKAEKRNFSPGFELQDWLEAKADLLKQISSDTPFKHVN